MFSRTRCLQSPPTPTNTKWDYLSFFKTYVQSDRDLIAFQSLSNHDQSTYQRYASLSELPHGSEEFGVQPDGKYFVYSGELFCRAKWDGGRDALCGVSL